MISFYSKGELVGWIGVAGYTKIILRCSCKVPSILPNCKQVWSFWTAFYWSPQYQISWKSIQWQQC